MKRSPRLLLSFFILSLLASCTLSKALIFNFSGVKDNRIFQEHPVQKGNPAFNFTEFGSTWGSSENARITTSDNRRRLLDDFLPESSTLAFLVIRHDSVLYERYFRGYSQEALVPSFSMAKSFVSALVGIALEEGKIHSLADSMTAYLPELQGKGLGNITLRHLLQMTSGLHEDMGALNPVSDIAKLYYGNNLRKLISKIKSDDPPGIAFEYRNINTQLLGAILERVTGKSLAAYLQEKIWTQIGMEQDASWSIDSKKSGMEKAFCCINATARDFARFGRLYLKKGNWEGKQVLPQKWVEESTKIDAKEGASVNYQYHWWITGTTGDFCARGMHGQYIYVNPSQNLVIVRLGKKEGDVNWIKVFKEIAGIKATPVINP